MKKTKPNDGAAAGVVVGPATDAVTAGMTAAGVSKGSHVESKFRPIDFSGRLLTTYYFLFHFFSCFFGHQLYYVVDITHH